MRSAMRCAACVLQSSHDAAPIAATAAMMRSHAASMPVPPSCCRRYGAWEPLACLWRERGFVASKGEYLEKRERPPGSVSAAAAGPSAGTSRRSRRPLCSAARFRPRCAGPSFQGLVQRVRDTYEVSGLRSGATANPSLPAEAPGNAQVRGLGEALSTPRGLPALQCHQLCPRRFYRVKGW